MQKDEIRELLVELISEAQDCGCDVTDVVDMIYVENEVLADHLLAHGVTFQRWIPVSESLPKKYVPVVGWTGHEELGEVWHDGEMFVWIDDEGEYARAYVTHWMPLPEPPKEVE